MEKYRIMKKTNKIPYVVNLTEAETPEDVAFEFARGKAKAGIALSEAEVMSMVAYGAKLTMEAIDDALIDMQPISFQTTDKKKIEKVIKILMPKEPWYKRFWKWLKKPFTKK